MNTKTITLAIAFTLTSIASQANPAWPSTQGEPFSSTLSREQVLAEFARAQAAGELDTARLAYGADSTAVNAPSEGRTRAEVRAELLAAKARGELDIGVLAYGAAPVMHGTASQSTLAAVDNTQKRN